MFAVTWGCELLSLFYALATAKKKFNKIYGKKSHDLVYCFFTECSPLRSENVPACISDQLLSTSPLFHTDPDTI